MNYFFKVELNINSQNSLTFVLILSGLLNFCNYFDYITRTKVHVSLATLHCKKKSVIFQYIGDEIFQ